jgi:hypothetical protein
LEILHPASSILMPEETLSLIRPMTFLILLLPGLPFPILLSSCLLYI